MGFVIGLLCGGFVGISIMCLFVAASYNEDTGNNE